MEPLSILTSHAASLPDADIDTDIIFPARFLLITTKVGLGKYAFYEKRRQGGVERPGFPLNDPAARGARILIAGPNFGCGSSREQAVWALHDLGFRVIIAASFGEIFQSNCFKSGVLPITLPPSDIALLQGAQADGEPLTVDLIRCRIATPKGKEIAFSIADWRRDALINGWDDVMMLINTQEDAIAAFERHQRIASPWLFTQDPAKGPHGQSHTSPKA